MTNSIEDKSAPAPAPENTQYGNVVQLVQDWCADWPVSLHEIGVDNDCIADLIHRITESSSSTHDRLTVESLRSELRQLFPDVQIIVDIRDCGTETQTPRGSTLEYGAQIGMNGNEFVGDSPAQVLAAVRAWKLKEGQK